jgi:hypothetical protein
MVRTQVYLPRSVHATLTRRAKEQGLTLAEQIRAALDEYLARLHPNESGGILLPDDPLLQMIGMIDSGVDDLGRNHDDYLYGPPRSEVKAASRVAEAKAGYKRRPRRSKPARKQSR